MIFWHGGRMYCLLRDGALPEAIYFDYSPKNVFNNMEIFGGRGFTRLFARVFKSSIVIHNKVRQYRGKHNPGVVDRIPIVGENEAIGNFPDRFAIRTKNIDLLRELLSMGKKVTWLEPDVYTQANYLGIFDFDNVFIDPYINTHIIYPTGEVKPADEAIHRGFRGWTIKYSKKIGFNLKDIHDRIDWMDYNRYRFIRGKKNNRGGYISKELAVNLYNIFSITYLIWRQSKLSAMTAKKEIAHRD